MGEEGEKKGGEEERRDHNYYEVTIDVVVATPVQHALLALPA